MVEGVEQTVLLALMGRLRRRWRWTSATEAGGMTCAMASAGAAIAVVFVRATGGPRPGIAVVAVPLAVVVAMSATAGALRRVTLAACARAVDRVLEQRDAAGGGRVRDDCVLAAVTLTADAVPATPFVTALVDVAIRRVRRVPPQRAIPPPRWRRLVPAPIAIAVLGLALFAPPHWLTGGRRSEVSVRTSGRQQTLPVGGTREGGGAPEARVAMPAAALEAEREEEAAALQAANDSDDRTLALMAEEFQRLLARLSGGGINAAAVLDGLERLEGGASGAARAALAATAAAEAAEASLRALKQHGLAGQASKELAETTAAPGGSDRDAEVKAAAAAARLAAAGEKGRAALSAAAGAAARSLAAAGSETAMSASAGGESRRRLDPGDTTDFAREDTTTPANAPGGGAVGEQQRHLEQLRRDLEEGQRGCLGDAAACAGTAENSGRALSRLQREGRTAEARQRFADAARQLLERIKREASGGAADDNPRRLRRFSQAAGGQPRGGDDPRPQSGLPPAPGSGTGGEPRAGAATGDGAGVPGPSASATRPRGGYDSSGGGRDDDGLPSADTRAGGTPGGGTPAHGDPAVAGESAAGRSGAGPAAGGEAAAAGGIGNAAGGPVLGPRARGIDGGGHPGRDTAAVVPSQGPGPARAQVISGAAAQGFVSTEYRRVFSEYRAAVEESMEATDVPAGKRFLVRRYFQLIRPRSNP